MELTAERRAVVVRLLGVLLDGLPVPTVRPLSTLGFVHDSVVRESCLDCLANGRAMFGCETCGGRGFVEARRRRDPYDTGAHVGALGLTERGREASRRRDREIAVLEDQLAPPASEPDLLAAANRRGEAWEVERAALRAAFDVVLAERALEALRGVDGDAYHAVMAVHVYGYLRAEGAAVGLAERGLVFVSGRLPEELRAPAAEAVVAAPLARRNVRIRTDYAEGVSVKEIAGRLGLSVSQVNRVLAGRDEVAG